MISFERGFLLKIMALASCFLMAATVTQSHAAATDANGNCSPVIQKALKGENERYNAVNDNFIRQNVTPPPSLSQVANTPCMSKELQRVANRFAYAPSMYSSQGMSQFTAAAGPVSGLMQKMFKSSFDSITKSASLVPAMANFQSMASTAMGSMLGSLGLGDAFSSEVCGLMVDMLVKYVQCEVPITLPNLGNLFGSLNNLLPNNCAGNALRSTLYSAGNMRSLQTYSQPITVTNGSYQPGSAETLNRANGLGALY